MPKFIRSIAFLCTIIVLLTACSNKQADMAVSSAESRNVSSFGSGTQPSEFFGNSSYSHSVSSRAVSSKGQDSTDTASRTPPLILNGVTRVSSEVVLKIKAGCTYREIADRLGGNEISGNAYLVDSERLFVLEFSDIDDVCEKSGKEILASAKSIYPPKEFEKKAEEPATAYGIIVGNGDIWYMDSHGSQRCRLISNDAEIKFANGQKATKADLKTMDGVIIVISRTLMSNPAQLICSEIIIIR